MDKSTSVLSSEGHGASGDVPIKLSTPAKMLWAKTNGIDALSGFSALYVHMEDSCQIAQYLWDEWLSESIKREIIKASGFEAAAKALVIWLACVHDIGKATPGFQYKVPELAELVCELGLTIEKPYKSTSHAFMGQIILEHWLTARGWEYPNTYASIIGGHHGAPPDYGVLETIMERNERETNEVIGDQNWASLQDELLAWAWNQTGMDKYEDEFIEKPFSPQYQVLLTGLTIMTDWIASNSELFPLTAEVRDSTRARLRGRDAWNELALPSAWQAKKEDVDCSIFFRARFKNLPADAEPNSVQRASMEIARKCENPGLLIIEAAMGTGKTEASLLGAEIFAGRFGEGGICYLLPTMATSNAMFARVEEWLESVPDQRDDARYSLKLVHGKAELNDDYRRLLTWGTTSMGDDVGKEGSGNENVIAHQWFGGRKKSLLASFVVATVDQLLMAALKTRHVQLRHLGLAGKVIVVDEVHAYDAYMSVYLHRILSWLGKYNVPVILLSATLPQSRREELILAYQGIADRDRTPMAIEHAPRQESDAPAYPLITYASANREQKPIYRGCSIDSGTKSVSLEFIDDTDETLINALRGLLSEGGCVCVLRDTVKRAQHTYKVLKESFVCDVRLVHSRFIARDRSENDKELLRLLGPESNDRPKAMIVVGTQVIEQSLDIDFDLLISDIAPVDLMLQRIGRLHRHMRGVGQCNRPPKLRNACCIITGVDDWNAAPPMFEKGIAYVYQAAILYRTILVLRQQSINDQIVIRIPDDIAPLVESVYDGEPELPTTWIDEFEKAKVKMESDHERQVATAKTWLLNKVPRVKRDLTGMLDSQFIGDDDQQGRAAVRDSQESIEVLLAQDVGGELRLLPWVIEEDVQNNNSGSLGDGRLEVDDAMARIAATCTVCLPPAMTYPGIIDQIIEVLESAREFSGWQDSRWLKGRLPLVLDTDLTTRIACGEQCYRLRYSKECGLELFEKQEDE